MSEEKGRVRFGSGLKSPAGGEGERCKYPTRLDTYGCGCSHDCAYCYAKALLEFRGLWDPLCPHVADAFEVQRMIKAVRPGDVVRLGGMTDCIQEAMEERYHVTRRVMAMLRQRGARVLVVTKSPRVATPEYLSVLDPATCYIQITMTSTDDVSMAAWEKAPPMSERVAAMKKLVDLGYNVACRVSPFVPGKVDPTLLGDLPVRKVVLEFLRLTSPILKNILKVEPTFEHLQWTMNDNGVLHLPLKVKRDVVEAIQRTGKVVSVCEDHPVHFEYWMRGVNPKDRDCCNWGG